MFTYMNNHLKRIHSENSLHLTESPEYPNHAPTLHLGVFPIQLLKTQYNLAVISTIIF